jgi:F0F1-type ATP synthase assembly protein I
MPEKDPDKSGMHAFGRLLSVGLMLPIATMVGYGIGYEIDQHAGTHYWAMVLMILGTVGGFIQLIREVTRG